MNTICLLLNFLLIFQINSQQSNPIQEITLNSTITNTNDNGELKYYKVTLDSNPDNADLLIIVKPNGDIREQISDPDIFVSKV